MAGTKANDRFLLLGDSITEWSFDPIVRGLGTHLSHLYQRRLDVLNRGLGGYNSRWLLSCLKEWLPPSPSSSQPHTQLATLWLGANDSVLPVEKQHVPLPEFRQNLTSIVNLLQSKSSPHYDPECDLILICCPPISVPDWAVERQRRGLSDRMDREQENTRRYADEVVSLGKELNLPVVNAFELIWNEAKRETEEGNKNWVEILSSFFIDGLHLSEKSYQLVVDDVKRVITERYPKKHWDTLPMLFPDWKSIPDESSPQEALSFIAENSAKK